MSLYVKSSSSAAKARSPSTNVWCNAIVSHKEFTMTPGQYIVIGHVTLANFTTNTAVAVRLVSAYDQSDTGVISELSYTSGGGTKGLYETFQVVDFINVTSNTVFRYYPQILLSHGTCDVAEAMVQVLKF